MSHTPFLSILIPTYNDVCVELATSLHQQASLLEGLSFELLVADDGSNDSESIAANHSIERLPHCRLLLQAKNIGRAAIRNFLAREAKGEWLLFVDSHMSVIRDNYLSTYLSLLGDTLLYGGYELSPEGPCDNLRYIYERSCIDGQRAEVRSQSPYANFHTSNFMVRREVMLSHPLDERFRRYGYEDVLFGKTLQKAGIGITHIDNPLGFNRFESNERFMEKTEEGLETLSMFRDELSGYSRLLQLSERLDHLHLSWLIRGIHRLVGPSLRRQLTGNHPSVLGFKIYRLGYFLGIREGG